MNIKSIRMKYRQKMAVMNGPHGRIAEHLQHLMERFNGNVDRAIQEVDQHIAWNTEKMRDDRTPTFHVIQHEQNIAIWNHVRDGLEDLRTGYWKIWNDRFIPSLSSQLQNKAINFLDPFQLNVLADALDDAGYEQQDATAHIRHVSEILSTGQQLSEMDSTALYRLLQYFARG